MAARTLNLYWWKGRDGQLNLGDEFTRILLDRAFTVSAVHTRYQDADFLSTGSILGWLFEREDMQQRDKQLTVLGSGFMHPWVNLSFRDYVNFSLVRGYFTSHLLSQTFHQEMPVGDPGLLFSDVVKSRRRNTKYRYGIIPHVSRWESLHLFETAFGKEDVTYIDFRTDDVDKVADLMTECDVIISQSLHGLIFADSLLIPNVWLTLQPGPTQKEFKFYDYFSVVGRPLFKKVNLKTATAEGVRDNTFFAATEVIESAKAAIRGAFAHQLNAQGIVVNETEGGGSHAGESRSASGSSCPRHALPE